MDVMIGIDPHKGSHTATMLDRAEEELKRIKVRAGSRQVAELLEWADGVRPRRWAVESAGGMGYLLAQQLVAAGETVLDVPATLASRVRVLASGQSTKTDPNDARSVAADGTVRGQLQLNSRGFDVFVNIAIDCLRVEGNIAYMSGLITHSSNPRRGCGGRVEPLGGSGQRRGGQGRCRSRQQHP